MSESESDSGTAAPATVTITKKSKRPATQAMMDNLELARQMKSLRAQQRAALKLEDEERRSRDRMRKYLESEEGLEVLRTRLSATGISKKKKAKKVESDEEEEVEEEKPKKSKKAKKVESESEEEEKPKKSKKAKKPEPEEIEAEPERPRAAPGPAFQDFSRFFA
jgi:hypothetical protein